MQCGANSRIEFACWSFFSSFCPRSTPDRIKNRSRVVYDAGKGAPSTRGISGLAVLVEQCLVRRFGGMFLSVLCEYAITTHTSAHALCGSVHCFYSRKIVEGEPTGPIAVLGSKSPPDEMKYLLTDVTALNFFFMMMYGHTSPFWIAVHKYRYLYGIRKTRQMRIVEVCEAVICQEPVS